MANGDIPKGNASLLAAIALGIVLQAGQNKAYGRLPGPFSAHIETFTRAIIAVLKQK